MPPGPELISPWYGDRYFSSGDGLAEALHVFVRGNGMAGLFAPRGALRVGETGFGTGLNLLAAVSDLAAAGLAGRLEWVSVEKHPLDPELAAAAVAEFSGLAGIAALFRQAVPDLQAGADGWRSFGFTWARIEVAAAVWRGDVLDMLAALRADPVRSPVDCWVLDGHSPVLNPDMWSPAVFAGLACCSRTDPPTRFATYTAAGTVKQGLRAAGFLVRRQPGYGAKRHMISGTYQGLAPGRSGGD